ncbi:hypothetical protein CLV63_104130 [Murinocardiopsis flavida]|uniref:DUF6841 domain-containing protein n=1 Tax=Murinocardiopsis flavida TaxID=645275 RepID=A0A2P8DNW3_9ACTN|nr:hypothetical protein [Murinocardiopsis flavida]PSK98906.1 hypothetical protein CLV63_104130 [Murinocardiopsis flavida]
MLDRHAVHEFFVSYGRALADGDLDGIAACYAYPAYVAGDAQSIAVAAPEDVIGAFAGAAERYRRSGVTRAVAETRGVEALTDSLISADVRWSYTDDRGTEARTESFRYLLRAGGGTVRICAVAATADAASR